MLYHFDYSIFFILFNNTKSNCQPRELTIYKINCYVKKNVFRGDDVSAIV
jgi:hypothetical protein